jgi:hypothetical protein
LPSKLEGLAAPSGVLAVGSIAIQLTDTIQKVNQFVRIVAGARKEANGLVTLLGKLRKASRQSNKKKIRTLQPTNCHTQSHL